MSAEKSDDRCFPARESLLLMVAPVHGPRPGRGWEWDWGGTRKNIRPPPPCKKHSHATTNRSGTRPTHRLPRAHCSGCSEAAPHDDNEQAMSCPNGRRHHSDGSIYAHFTSCRVGPIGETGFSRVLHGLRTHRPLPLVPSRRGYRWDDLTAAWCPAAVMPSWLGSVAPERGNGARLVRDIIATGRQPPHPNTSSGISGAVGGPGCCSRRPINAR